MRDISLHILDLIENSLRAGATHVIVVVDQQPAEDRMTVAVEDNGPGLPVSNEVASDPFFTTKAGKRVGLGLSLFRAAAERAGGTLSLDRSSLGGLAVRATFQLNHIDRSPLGDLAATLSTLCLTSPAVRFTARLRMGAVERVVDSAREAEQGIPACREPLEIAQRVQNSVRGAIQELCLLS